MTDHPQVRILRAVKSTEARNGEHLYEIEPISYAGPWELKPGTVLEVVAASGDQKASENS